MASQDDIDRLRAELEEWRRRAEVAEAVAAERLARAESAERALRAAEAALMAPTGTDVRPAGKVPEPPPPGDWPPPPPGDLPPPAGVPSRPATLRERWRRYTETIN